MDTIVKQCLKCKQVIGCCKKEDVIHTANNCNGELKMLNISWDELSIIEDISTDNDFLQAMIDLKEKDIIEYNLKMSQFRNQLEQQKSSKIQNDNRPKCPTCNSTNLKKISGTSKAVSVAMFGLLSQKVKKTYHCNACGYERVFCPCQPHISWYPVPDGQCISDILYGGMPSIWLPLFRSVRLQR